MSAAAAAISGETGTGARACGESRPGAARRECVRPRRRLRVLAGLPPCESGLIIRVSIKLPQFELKRG